MFNRIVVGFDGSDQDRDALALARALAGPGSEVMTRAVPSGSIANGIHALASETGADLIVAGSTHHGAVGKVIVGGIGEKLLQGSPCPVAIAPKGFAESHGRPLQRIVVAHDGSPEAEHALDLAIALARESGGALRICTVMHSLARGDSIFPSDYGWPRHFEHAFNRAQERLDSAVRRVPEDVEASGELLFGSPAEVLANEARDDADLLVTGSRGYGPLRGVFLGRVSAELARSAPCPMIVAPRGALIPSGSRVAVA